MLTISLITLILISNKIILLNEEILILFCFVLFCLLAYNSTKKSIYLELKSRKVIIKDSLFLVFNNTITKLLQQIIIEKKSQKLTNNFVILQLYIYSIIEKTCQSFPKTLLQNNYDLYKKKIIYTHNFEQQMVKLLTLLLVKKVNDICLMQKFYVEKLLIPDFVCLKKIVLRESFEFI